MTTRCSQSDALGAGPARQAARGLTLAVAAVTAAFAIFALGCLPDPLGRCVRDADCAAGPAGSFCAEAVCQGPPVASIEVPAATLPRAATAVVRVHVTRAHGGPAAATARFEAGAVTGAATRDPDGALRLEVPCSFAPAGVEGPAALAVIVADDLGHQTRLAASLQIDDRGPLILVDPASLPAGATLRGARVPLRVLLTDGSGPLSLRFSLGAAAARDGVLQADGSFRAEVDTREAPAGADLAEVWLIARDTLGNESRTAATFALTRVKWTARSMGGSAASSLALGHDAFVVLTSDKRLLLASRRTGGITERSLSLTSDVRGNLVVDGAFVYTALVDGRVCKLGLDGSVRFCCDPAGPIAGSPALGLFPSRTAGSPAEPALIVTTSDPARGGARLFAIREQGGFCQSTPSVLVAPDSLGTPAIAADGTVFAAGRGVVVAGRFDGFAWSVQSFNRSATYLGQPALALPVTSGAAAGQRLVLSTTASATEALLFAPASTSGGPLGAPAELYRSPISTGQYLRSTSAVLTEDGTALVGVPDDAALIALAPDGARRWSAALPGGPSAAVLGEGGLVYVATDDGTVSALDVATGQRVWRYRAGAPIHAPPVLGCDGILYGATDTGGLFALATDSAGPSTGPWPREGHDPRGTGDARRALRPAGGGCAEE